MYHVGDEGKNEGKFDKRVYTSNFCVMKQMVGSCSGVAIEAIS